LIFWGKELVGEMSKNPQNDYKNTVFKVVSENDHSRFMNEMTQSKLFEIRITDVGFLTGLTSEVVMKHSPPLLLLRQAKHGPGHHLGLKGLPAHQLYR